MYHQYKSQSSLEVPTLDMKTETIAWALKEIQAKKTAYLNAQAAFRSMYDNPITQGDIETFRRFDQMESTRKEFSISVDKYNKRFPDCALPHAFLEGMPMTQKPRTEVGGVATPMQPDSSRYLRDIVDSKRRNDSSGIR